MWRKDSSILSAGDVPHCSFICVTANVAFWHEAEVAPAFGDFRYRALSRHPRGTRCH